MFAVFQLLCENYVICSDLFCCTYIYISLSRYIDSQRDGYTDMKYEFWFNFPVRLKVLSSYKKQPFFFPRVFEYSLV